MGTRRRIDRAGRHTDPARGPRRRGRTRRVALVALGALLFGAAGVLLLPTSAAAGGGEWLYPLRDRYEPGETATMVGYSYVRATDVATDGPFYAYLRTEPEARQLTPGPLTVGPGDIPLGRVHLQDGPGGRFALRVAAEFRLPADLPPGRHDVVVCNDPCTTTIGYILASSIHVGVDPPEPIVRLWPLDEPAIRWLDDDALVWGPPPSAEAVTAADVRAGRIVAPPPPSEPAPPPAPAPAAVRTTPAAADARLADPDRPGNTGAQPAVPQGRGGSPLDDVTRTAAGDGSGGDIGTWVSQAVAAAALVLGLAWLWRLHRWTPRAGDRRRGRRPLRRVVAPDGTAPAPAPNGRQAGRRSVHSAGRPVGRPAGHDPERPGTGDRRDEPARPEPIRL
ncbi:MAG TPA: hypothetical protein VFZ77_19385 [Acidimicrobiales bacterium]